MKKKSCVWLKKRRRRKTKRQKRVGELERRFRVFVLGSHKKKRLRFSAFFCVLQLRLFGLVSLREGANPAVNGLAWYVLRLHTALLHACEAGKVGYGISILAQTYTYPPVTWSLGRLFLSSPCDNPGIMTNHREGR